MEIRISLSPRTDPDWRVSRIRLLPQVVTRRRREGSGWQIWARGCQREMNCCFAMVLKCTKLDICLSFFSEPMGASDT